MATLTYNTRAVILEGDIADSKFQKELTNSYNKLFFASTKIKKQQAAYIIKSAKNQVAIPITDEILYASLDTIVLDVLNNVENQLILINLFNNNSKLRTDFFGRNNPDLKIEDISLTSEIPIEKISAELLQAELGLEDFKIYQRNPKKWLRKKENKDKLEEALNNINESAASIVKQITAESRIKLWDKFYKDKDFAYSFFARWSVPKGQISLTPKVLKMLALKNAGAALGILSNPELRGTLFAGLIKEDISLLLQNAAEEENPCHQHYFSMTLDLLLHKKKNSVIGTIKAELNDNSTNNKIRDILLNMDVRHDIGNIFEKHFDLFLTLVTNPSDHLSHLLFHTTNPVAMLKKLFNYAYKIQDRILLNSIIEQVGTIITSFANKKSRGQYKNISLDEVINFMYPHIENLISLYEAEKRPAQAEQLRLIFNNTKISEKLNVSINGLQIIYSTTGQAIEPLYDNKLNLRNFLKGKTNISDEMAFVIVNRSELWNQVNPNKYRSPIKRKLNEWLGWFKDQFEGERERLGKLNPIFAKKFKGEAIQIKLENKIDYSNWQLINPNLINMEAIITDEISKNLLPETPVKKVDDSLYETPQSSKNTSIITATPIDDLETFSTPKSLGTPINELGIFSTPKSLGTPVNELGTFSTPKSLGTPVNELGIFSTPKSLGTPVNELGIFSTPKSLGTPVNELGILSTPESPSTPIHRGLTTTPENLTPINAQEKPSAFGTPTYTRSNTIPKNTHLKPRKLDFFEEEKSWESDEENTKFKDTKYSIQDPHIFVK